MPDGVRYAGTGILIPMGVILLLFVGITIILAWKLHQALKSQQGTRGGIEETAAAKHEILLQEVTAPNHQIVESANLVNEHQLDANNIASTAPQENQREVEMPSWPEAEPTDNCIK